MLLPSGAFDKIDTFNTALASDYLNRLCENFCSTSTGLASGSATGWKCRPSHRHSSGERTSNGSVSGDLECPFCWHSYGAF